MGREGGKWRGGGGGRVRGIEGEGGGGEGARSAAGRGRARLQPPSNHSQPAGHTTPVLDVDPRGQYVLTGTLQAVQVALLTAPRALLKVPLGHSWHSAWPSVA